MGITYTAIQPETGATVGGFKKNRELVTIIYYQRLCYPIRLMAKIYYNIFNDLEIISRNRIYDLMSK